MKYIIFDLDDTVIPRGKPVSQFTIDTFKAYQDAGYTIVIDTARGKSGTLESIQMFNADYAICNGGALILNHNGDVLYSSNMDLSLTNNLIKDLLPIIDHMGISFESNEGLFSPNPEDIMMSTAHYYDFSKPVENVDVYKVVCCSMDFDLMRKVAARYGFDYTNYLNSPWGRITNAGINKWTGVLHLLELTGGKVEDTIAFGDDFGDMELLQNAHIGVAMANSKDTILEAIPTKCGRCEDDGVAHYLLEHISK